MTEEDKSTVTSLYQKCPTLWEDFRNVTACMDVLQERPVNYNILATKLMKLNDKMVKLILDRNAVNIETMVNFLAFFVSVGFVESFAAFYRQLIADVNIDDIAELKPPWSGSKTCICLIKIHFLNGVSDSSVFARRLVQTGYVDVMAKEIQHFHHLTGKVLVSKSELFL
jgi:hypothetical protein